MLSHYSYDVFMMCVLFCPFLSYPGFFSLSFSSKRIIAYSISPLHFRLPSRSRLIISFSYRSAVRSHFDTSTAFPSPLDATLNSPLSSPTYIFVPSISHSLDAEIETRVCCWSLYNNLEMEIFHVHHDKVVQYHYRKSGSEVFVILFS